MNRSNKYMHICMFMITKGRKRIFMYLTVFYNSTKVSRCSKSWIWQMFLLKRRPILLSFAILLPSGPSPARLNPSSQPILSHCPSRFPKPLHGAMHWDWCRLFLRFSATVMFFFAVKFNHFIQVLLLVFLSVHQPPCAWQTVILGRHITIAIQERRRKRKQEELIGWLGWLILDESMRCWPNVECEIVTQSTIRFVFHLPSFLLSLPLPLYTRRLRVYWIEFFDFHSLWTKCNQTTAPSATLHEISSLKCFAKWLRSLLRKLFELFQKYEMSWPSQLGSVLCVSAWAGKWEEWGIRRSSREKIPAQGAFAIGFQNGAFRSPSSQQAS